MSEGKSKDNKQNQGNQSSTAIIELDQSTNNKTQEKIQMKYITFKSSVLNVVTQQDLLLIYDSVFSKKFWKIQNNNAKYDKIIKILSHIESCQTQSLNLTQNFCQGIISQICLTSFCKLEHLNLTKNKINNIEALIFLQCPFLKQLNLQSNFICSLKAFENKFNQKLGYSGFSLVIRDNLIQNLSLFKIQTSQQTSWKINIQMNVTTQSQDLSNFCKFYKVSNLTLDIKSARRINQKKISTMLKNKYEYLQYLDWNYYWSSNSTF